MLTFNEIERIPLITICKIYEVELKSFGQYWIGSLKPNTPNSFMVNPIDNTWRDSINLCGGGSISLVSEIENVNMRKAKEILVKKFYSEMVTNYEKKVL